MTKQEKRIIPALLTEKPTELASMLMKCEQFSTWVQIDIMDGLFVPSRSITAQDIHYAGLCVDWEAHLMVNEPEQYLYDFQAVGAKRIIVHYETITGRELEVVAKINELGMEAGVALNPNTPSVVLVPELLQMLDCVLFMAVYPGFYGAKFVPQVLDKIRMFRKDHQDIRIGIDGGVKLDNIQEILLSGVDDICVGSAIFAQQNPEKAYLDLLRASQKD
ncbi:MAG: ribulose-phosphate 3-epimerase [Dehalococcoidia bacterium]|nr:ribulose-phosphate 3-epimerase [Dehalococcoidia bacterium]